MYLETVDKFSDLAAKKVKYQKKSPTGFFLGAMVAGVYVGLAIILISPLATMLIPACADW